ncbi:MAG: hypothetical protein IAE64_04025 [Flavobacteriales bacterium]|nr:MAG: hypothetical protein F9K28_02760 [Bacteroidota bacterium]MBE2265400.1 hypothetical protein [Flavobacteriales bacterium]MBV6463753.1 hypothetical protein [Chlorobiota bacterium]MBW7853624.1 hypothetical protein [Candidatus Kapabacteria bacterium]MCC6332142.1 hypothetical protein [Ignavibacteria bacterium]
MRFFHFSVAVLALCAVTGTTSAQKLVADWTWLSPRPTGLTLSSVAAISGTGTGTGTGFIVAGQGNLLAVGSSENSDWTELPTSENVVSCASANTTVWFVTGTGSVLTSTNGVDFSAVSLPESAQAICVAARDNVVAIGCTLGRVAISDNGGASFTVHKLLTDGNCIDLAVDAYGKVLALTPAGDVFALYGAAEPVRYAPAFTGTFTSLCITANGTLLVGSEQKGVFRRAPNDQFWVFSTLDVPGTVTDLCVDANDTVYAALKSGEILHSANDGVTFTTNTTVAPLTILHMTPLYNGGMVAVGTAGCVMVRKNANSGWQQHTTRSAFHATAFLPSSNSSLLFGCTDGSLFRADRNGTTTKLPFHANGAVRGLSTGGGSVIWMLTDHVFDNLFTSSDSGATWTQHLSTDGQTTSSFRLFKAVSPTCLYAVRLGTIQKSADSGKTWTAVPVVINGETRNIGTPVEFVSENVVWAVDYSSNDLYYTSNGGVTWTTVPHSSMGTPHFIAANSAGAVVTGTSVSFNVSTNNGQTWTRTPETARPFDIAVASDSGAFAILSANVLYVRYRDDATWTAFPLPGGTDYASYGSDKCLTFIDNHTIAVSIGPGTVAAVRLRVVSGIAENQSPLPPKERIVRSDQMNISGGITNGVIGVYDVNIFNIGGMVAGTASLTVSPNAGVLSGIGGLAKGLYVFRSANDGNTLQQPAVSGYFIVW